MGGLSVARDRHVAREFCNDSEFVYVCVVHEAIFHLPSYLGLTPRRGADSPIGPVGSWDREG